MTTLSSKTAGNADTEHLWELIQIPTSGYATCTASHCRDRIRHFPCHNHTFTRTSGPVILTNVRKRFAKAKNIYATRQRQLRYYLINQRNKLRIPGCPPSYFFPSPFTLESWLRTLSWKTQCFREETDHSTNGTGSFQASEVCAWILSGWQTSSVHMGIPHSCGQVCLRN